MKSLRVLALAGLGALSLAGCGSGSVKSPDFTPLLRALTLNTTAALDSTDPNDERFFIPLGQGADLQLSGECSTPPGSALDLQPCNVSDASYVVTPVVGDAGAASVVNGQLIGSGVGRVLLIATQDGIESEPALEFRIGPAIISNVNITPDNPPPVSVNESITFTAEGTFSDGTTDDIVVTWTVTDAQGNPLPDGTVDFQPGPGNTTTITPQPGSEGQTIVVTGTFTADDGNGNPVTESDSTTVTIGNEVLAQLLRIQPQNPTVAPNASVPFTAVGQYTGGNPSPREGTIPASQVMWMSANTAAATINAETGVATGQPPGGADTLITGTLRPAVTTEPGSNRSASTTLTVTTAGCTSPLLAVQGATTSSETSGLCIGCSVSNGANVIDASPDTFAIMSAPVGLLAGSLTLNVDAAPAAADFPAGSRAGLIVAKPAGLLSAELLSSLSISTRSNGSVVQAAGAGQATTLDVALLGLIGGQDAALLSFPTSQPFDGLALTFDVGVLSLLPTINVFQACGVTTP